jgi:hypothetical protein
MKKLILIYTLLLLNIPAHMQAQKPTEKKQEKLQQEALAFEATKELIESGDYNFWADRLNASGGLSKSLTTTPNNLRINGGEAQISLPYFGVVRANSPYQVDGGIKYEGAIENYRVDIKEGKRKIVIKFDIDRGIEEHNFIMTVSKTGFTRLTVISSGRTTITYYGYTRAPDANAGF